MSSANYSVRWVRHASDGLESWPIHHLPAGFVPEYFGVYATSKDGTDRWVADFADRFRAKQYAGLFSEPMLGEDTRCYYRCPACGLEWDDACSPWWANCQVCEERDIEPYKEEPI